MWGFCWHSEQQGFDFTYIFYTNYRLKIGVEFYLSVIFDKIRAKTYFSLRFLNGPKFELLLRSVLRHFVIFGRGSRKNLITRLYSLIIWNMIYIDEISHVLKWAKLPTLLTCVCVIGCGKGFFLHLQTGCLFSAFPYLTFFRKKSQCCHYFSWSHLKFDFQPNQLPDSWCGHISAQTDALSTEIQRQLKQQIWGGISTPCP